MTPKQRAEQLGLKIVGLVAESLVQTGTYEAGSVMVQHPITDQRLIELEHEGYRVTPNGPSHAVIRPKRASLLQTGRLSAAAPNISNAPRGYPNG